MGTAPGGLALMRDKAGVLARIGGIWGIGVSLILFVMVVARPGVDLNVLNGATIFGGLLAGLIALRWPGRALALAAATGLFVLAMVPALPGAGVGLLYVPAVLLILSALGIRIGRWSRRARRKATQTAG